MNITTGRCGSVVEVIVFAYLPPQAGDLRVCCGQGLRLRFLGEIVQAGAAGSGRLSERPASCREASISRCDLRIPVS